MRLIKEGFGKIRTTTELAYIGGVLGIAVVLLIVNFWYINRQSGYDRRYVALAEELRVLSQSISKNSNEAIDGNTRAFEFLKSRRDEFDQYLLLFIAV